MGEELNVLALVKGKERFIYVFDDASRELLVDVFRDHAAHPHLALTWFDALVLGRKVLEQGEVVPPAFPSRESTRLGREIP